MDETRALRASLARGPGRLVQGAQGMVEPLLRGAVGQHERELVGAADPLGEDLEQLVGPGRIALDLGAEVLAADHHHLHVRGRGGGGRARLLVHQRQLPEEVARPEGRERQRPPLVGGVARDPHRAEVHQVALVRGIPFAEDDLPGAVEQALGVRRELGQGGLAVLQALERPVVEVREAARHGHDVLADLLDPDLSRQRAEADAAVHRGALVVDRGDDMGGPVLHAQGRRHLEQRPEDVAALAPGAADGEHAGAGQAHGGARRLGLGRGALAEAGEVPVRLGRQLAAGVVVQPQRGDGLLARVGDEVEAARMGVEPVGDVRRRVVHAAEVALLLRVDMPAQMEHVVDLAGRARDLDADGHGGPLGSRSVHAAVFPENLCKSRANGCESSARFARFGHRGSAWPRREGHAS